MRWCSDEKPVRKNKRTKIEKESDASSCRLLRSNARTLPSSSPLTAAIARGFVKLAPSHISKTKSCSIAGTRTCSHPAQPGAVCRAHSRINRLNVVGLVTRLPHASWDPTPRTRFMVHVSEHSPTPRTTARFHRLR